MVLKDGEGDAGATKTGEDDKKDIGKLFDQKKEDAKEENIAKAAASIGVVTGADILQAITTSKDNPVEDAAEGINAAKDAAEIAIAKAVNDKKERLKIQRKKMQLLQRG